MSLFHENLIFLDFQASDQFDFLNQMAGFLIKENYVLPSYLEAILERERKYPTGLPSEPFPVAIPHGDPEHVIEPCIVVVRPHAPIPFGEMGTADSTVLARYIFMLVVKRAENQIALLQNMIDMFMREEAMLKLDKADTASEIMAVLKEYINIEKEETE